MAVFDVAFCGLLFVSGVVGFWRGIAREILSLSAWILAGGLTLLALPGVYSTTLSFISSPFWALCASGGGLFFLSLLTLLFFVDGLVCWIRSGFLRRPDRILGFLWGLLRGVLAALGVYWFATLYVHSPAVDAFFAPSVTAPVLEKLRRRVAEQKIGQLFFQGAFTHLKARLGPLIADVEVAESSSTGGVPPAFSPKIPPVRGLEGMGTMDADQQNTAGQKNTAGKKHTAGATSEERQVSASDNTTASPIASLNPSS